MASARFGFGSVLLVLGIILVMMPGQAAAFGAGNIPSIAQVEGHNWRHGDIEDTLKTIAFLGGKKWTTLLVKKVYFGNWLRDYSQAIDTAGLKGVNAETLRVLVWILSFLANGYATEEFEVTAERLGTYRPEEHIDNPLGYPEDAQKSDKRLRGPVRPIEVEIDPQTGMKNYIANEKGDWATSAGYLRFSLARSIHYGRLYTSGAKGSGKEEDLNEALRCLGQALHCMEDFPAHSNYCELALRELGYRNVYPHCGTDTEINLRGKHVFPLVTGTFGGVDFFHSVLGEANDHFTQAEVSEVDQMDLVLKNCEKNGSSAASTSASRGVDGNATRGLLDFGFGGRSSGGAGDFVSLIGQLPGIGGGFASEARDLQQRSEDQRRRNDSGASMSRSRGDSYSRSRAEGGQHTNQNIVPGMSEDFDPVKVSKQIYPILEFRDKIVKAINRGISKIPGLESLLEHISETLTAFVLGLLAPFIRPIIQQVTKVLKQSSSSVIDASAHSQLEPWKNPHCSDPTHSMLSKDHFTNVLNSCAGRVAATILQYTVPRVLYAWENTGVPVDEVLNDVLRAFHHPAIRDDRCEIQRDMYTTVRKWADEYPRRHDLDRLLGSESVKNGKNHIQHNPDKPGSGSRDMHDSGGCGGSVFSQPGHGHPTGSLWSQVKTRDLDDMGVGNGQGGMRPDYASTSRPSSRRSESPERKRPSPSYGYHHGAGATGEAASYHSPYPSDQPSQHSQSSQYGRSEGSPYGQQQRPPTGEAASYGQPSYGGGAPPPQQYGGPPPGQGGYYGGGRPQSGGYPGGPRPQSGGYPGGPGPRGYGSPLRAKVVVTTEDSLSNSLRTASNRTTSNRTTSNRTTSNRMASNRMVSNRHTAILRRGAMEEPPTQTIEHHLQ